MYTSSFGWQTITFLMVKTHLFFLALFSMVQDMLNPPYSSLVNKDHSKIFIAQHPSSSAPA